MSTLYAIAALETLFWVFFYRQASYFHACALLILVKIFFPIVRSALLHVFYRIPRAILKHTMRAQLRSHWDCLVDPYGLKRNSKLARKQLAKKEPPIAEAMQNIDEEYEELVKSEGKR
jgi:hypothetical protein